MIISLVFFILLWKVIMSVLSHVQKELQKLQQENTQLRSEIDRLTTEVTKQTEKIEQLTWTNVYFEDCAKNCFLHRGPVVLFKRQNKPGRPVEFVSSNVTDVFWYTPEDFRGKDLYIELIHPQDLQRVCAEVALHTSGKDRFFVHQPYRVHHKQWHYVRIYDYTTIIRNETWDAETYIGYIIDITSKQEIEEQMVSADQIIPT